jgi:hypothetical protein
MRTIVHDRGKFMVQKSEATVGAWGLASRAHRLSSVPFIPAAELAHPLSAFYNDKDYFHFNCRKSKLAE